MIYRIGSQIKPTLILVGKLFLDAFPGHSHGEYSHPDAASVNFFLKASICNEKRSRSPFDFALNKKQP